MSLRFNILVLGSGAATPTHARHCSGQVVTIGGKRMLIDCGESTQSHLRQYHQRIQSFDTIFISHLHGDHFFGLPGLLSTMHLCGRTEPITVFAPKGIKAAIELLFNVSGTDIRYELNIVELDFDDKREIYRNPLCTVYAFPLRHSVPTYGFIFQENTTLLNLRKEVKELYNLSNEDCVHVKLGGDLTLADGRVIPNKELTLPPLKPRSYAYCCDTQYFDELVSYVDGVDLLCMESTFGNEYSNLADECLHCTASQAASIASQAHTKQLLLTHFSARYKDLTPLYEEATAIFPNTITAADGALYNIERVENQNESRTDTLEGE